MVTLQKFRGWPVVLEWTNPDRPYVKKHYETKTMQRLQSEAIAADAVWLTVTSTPAGRQGHMSPLEADAWLQRQQSGPTALLIDHDGALADAYGVGLALHMFVIDTNGRLAYMGAIADRPTARHADVAIARNYVRDAPKAAAAGKPPSPAVTRP